MTTVLAGSTGLVVRIVAIVLPATDY